MTVQQGAGAGAYFTDEAYGAAGAERVTAEVALGAQIVLKVHAPSPAELPSCKADSVLIGMLNPFDQENIARMAQAGVIAFSLEAAPRTTRAQSLDVLSSQANIAGYRAVLMASRPVPTLYAHAHDRRGYRQGGTRAGTGARGWLALQAIATAKRLGAVVEASDVRPAVKEQIESLGAKFLDVPFETQEEREAAEGVGGYARPMPQSWLTRQSALVHERAKQADIVIATALIPGRPAPMLLSEDAVKAMKPGSVIVDLAAGRGANGGGNCPLTEADKTVTKYDVQIVGHTNLPSTVATDASALYARNLLDFLKLIVDKDGQRVIDMQDDIVAATLLCRDGQVLRAASWGAQDEANASTNASTNASLEREGGADKA